MDEDRMLMKHGKGQNIIQTYGTNGRGQMAMESNQLTSTGKLEGGQTSSKMMESVS
jgi:hypothetical protein